MKKAIVTAGGKGTRVHALTGSVLPKGLSRLSRTVHKPLVSYQLDMLAARGYSRILMSFDTDWQVQLFKQSLAIGEVPDLDYTFEVIQWKHPLTSFRRPEIREFIGSDNFLWTFGDTFYPVELIDAMERLMWTNGTSVACMMHSRSHRWVKNGKRLTFHMDKVTHRIVDYTLTRQGSFTLHVPFLLQNRALAVIDREASIRTPHSLSLLKRLARESQLSVVKPRVLVNMNTPPDVRKVERSIARFVSANKGNSKSFKTTRSKARRKE